jgi:hypothetical protein
VERGKVEREVEINKIKRAAATPENVMSQLANRKLASMTSFLTGFTRLSLHSVGLF